MVYPHPDTEKGISFYSSNLIKNIKKQGVDIYEVTFIQGKPFTIFNKILKLLDYDIIHIQHEYNLIGFYGIPYFILLLFLRLFKKKALIVTMHTVLSQKEEFKSGRVKTFLRKLLYRVQNKWINWASDKIIVHSNSFKKVFVEEYGIPERKVHVFPHAIIEDIKTIDKPKAKKELKLSGPVYLLIGTMGPDHGHDIVIHQADRIGKTILVATNPSAVNYRNVEKIKEFLKLNQEIVKKNHFEKFVRFDVGVISNEDWWKYFSASDLILLPYRGGIGSGIFADAMAAKKPVIASNIKYFREISGNYGCLNIAKRDEDFPNVIKEVMKTQNYKKMVKECERFVKENGLTPISKKYQEFYNSL